MKIKVESYDSKIEEVYNFFGNVSENDQKINFN